ncbi:hypothetical protein C2W62_16920 [Candidatus Entotheonella serta]|nr:hypothetical protein C2W62_16920 [Candidatus Entotheonella serta]
MCSPSRFTICLCAFLIFFLGWFPASSVLAWTLHFAPLDHTTSHADAFAPSTSAPVAPQLFRIVVAPQQVTIGTEAPYIRHIRLDPPIRFKALSPEATPPVSNARQVRPRHQLRGPEAFLLRRTQNVAGKPLP